LSLFVYPPDAIWLMYYDYGYYVEEYDLFCLSMIMVFILMPLALFLSWTDIARSIKVHYAPSVGRLFGLVFLTVMLMIISSGWLGLDIYEDSLFYLAARILMFFLDWIGAIIYNMFFLYFLFWISILTYKNFDKYKNQKRC